MIIFRLSKYVVLPILIEWMSMVDLAKLDSAVCNSRMRPMLMVLISSVPFNGLKDICCGDSYLLWLDLRQIKVLHVNYVLTRNRSRERMSCCIGALYDSVLGKKLIFPVNSQKLIRTARDQVSERSHYLSKMRYLKFNIDSKLTDRGLNQIAEHCKQLYELTIISNRSNIFINSQVFFKIIQTCTDLKVLTLERCTMTMKSFNHIFHCCLNLTTMNFNNSTITDAETRNIQYNGNDRHYYTGVTSMNCSTLTSLSMCGVIVMSGGHQAHSTADINGVRNLNTITNNGGGGGRYRSPNRPNRLDQDELPELLFITIIQNNVSLTNIAMNYNQYCTTYTLSQIASHCPDLLSLDICYSYNFKDEGLMLVCNSCTKLQYINLHDCNVTEQSIYQLATNCFQLIYVEIQQLNDSEINILTLNCKQLQAFKLVNNVLATTVGINYIVTRCIHLLELIYSAYTLTCDQITNATVITMASNCDQLKSFVCIQRWNAITDTSIKILAQKCLNLEKLVLTYNNILSDSSIHELAAYSKKLTHLDISNCEYISDSPIMRISSCCPDLRFLDLYHCNDVSDLCIYHLVTHSLRLTSLTLPDTGVTESTIVDIGNHCNELRLLRVNQQFTYSQIALLKRKRPNLIVKFGKDIAHIHHVYTIAASEKVDNPADRADRLKYGRMR